jgi:hypothetical protein
MFDRRSCLLRRLAALIAAIAVLISARAFDLSPLTAHPPPKHAGGGPSPQEIQRKLEEQQRKEQQMLQQMLKQQQQHQQHMQKLLQEHQKQQLKKQAGTPPHGKQPHVPKPGAQPKLPAITAKHFPNKKQACNALLQALRHVHAASKFPAEPREMAAGNIRAALLGLGEVPPTPPPPPVQRGDHIGWAKEDLQRAHRDVINARNLPHPVKTPVLAEIHRAIYFLNHPGMPFPKMEQAHRELVQAMHQVHAAPALEVRAKETALANIREALIVLGEVPPAPVGPTQRGDHIRLAEGHLHRAYKDVSEARHLPHEQRAPALWEIHHAMFVLHEPAAKFPDMKDAKNQLVYAWHQVHAVHGIRDEMKKLALGSIGEAMMVLGEKVPSAWPNYPKADHIKLAEEHLHKAHEDVAAKRPFPQKESVLEEIHRAAVVLKHAANPDKGVAAPK